jgi:hypothetical protein
MGTEAVTLRDSSDGLYTPTKGRSAAPSLRDIAAPPLARHGCVMADWSRRFISLTKQEIVGAQAVDDYEE